MAQATAADQPEDWGASRNKLGMWLFLCGDAMMFIALFAGYALIRAANAEAWPDPFTDIGIPFWLVMTITAILVSSSYTMAKAFYAADENRLGWDYGVKFWLGLTVLLGLAFLSMQIYEWSDLLLVKGMFPGQIGGVEGMFLGCFYALTGFHGLHVLSGTTYNGIVLFNTARGKYDGDPSEAVELAGLYWHFVDLVWILVLTFLYLL